MSKIFQPAYNLKISVSDGRTQVGSRTLSVHLTSEYVSTQSDISHLSHLPPPLTYMSRRWRYGETTLQVILCHA